MHPGNAVFVVSGEAAHHHLHLRLPLHNIPHQSINVLQVSFVICDALSPPPYLLIEAH